MLKKIAVLFVILAISGVAAFFIAVGLSSYGYLGSCFEGACAYAAIFYAFPVFWLILAVGLMIGWKLWKPRSR